MNATLTAVPGIRVGHATDSVAMTGCTVILGPFRAAVDVRGLASGTRQLDSLTPGHLVDRADAILLTGGSAYGLAAADGVAEWLEERGSGYPAGDGRVAIVPTAVIFDLGRGRKDRRPGPEMGRGACEAASDAPVQQGRVGVGAGASVGKLFGPERATPAGLGSYATTLDDHAVAALVVVNAFGDVVDARGEIVAGARGDDGSFVGSAQYLRNEGLPPRFGGEAGGSTTLAVIATDHPLGRLDLRAVARQAMNAIVRRTSPANTQFDGDLVFAVSTAEDAHPVVPPAEVLRIGVCAEAALASAVELAAGG